MNDFEQVWAKIVAHQGEDFYTKSDEKRCNPFVYTISGNTLTTDRTDQQISRRNFEKIFDDLPLDGPGEVNGIIRGSAYVWAILHDPRIRGSMW